MITLDTLRADNPDIRPDFTIRQRWDDYNAAEHGIWRTLYRRMEKILPGRASDEFLERAEGAQDRRRTNSQPRTHE